MPGAGTEDFEVRLSDAENRITALETHHGYAQPAISRLTDAITRLESRLANVESKVLVIVSVATVVITLAQIALRFMVK